jgi:hypothetical protein
MRLLCLMLAALALTGCAGWKMGGGYAFDTRQFFFSLERPLEPGFKK